MTHTTKEQADIELAMAQRQKVLAEIEVLRRTTPLTETIKLIGSMVLGIGGAVAAIAGFQLAEVKAEKFKAEASAAEQARVTAQTELDRLNKAKAGLSEDLKKVQLSLQAAKRDYADISDKLAVAEREAQSPALSSTLKSLQQSVNAADIALRAAAPTGAQNATGTPLDTLVERLYATQASVRGAAYEELMGAHAKDPALVPALLAYAEPHLDNANGLFNSVVVLLGLERSMLTPHLAEIRALAEKSKANGPKTAERADQLLQRLSP